MTGTFQAVLLTLVAAVAVPANAADYQIDPAHSFVQFRVQHLGYSWLYGRFNGVDGTFSYDAASPQGSSIQVNIDTTSIDTNHAERDKHLRSAEFLGVDTFGVATFTSTSFKGTGDSGVMTGVLNFHGVKKTIEIPLKKLGEGPDPWGGYRAGFEGTYTMTRADFGMDFDLGPASTTVELELGIEGTHKQ